MSIGRLEFDGWNKTDTLDSLADKLEEIDIAAFDSLP